MRLILGIGNRGERYKKNRHNVGFMFLDYLAEKYSLSFVPSRNEYFVAEHVIGGNQFALIKPSNFVNNSGFSAVQALSHYNASIEDLLVVHDDVYLQTGTFRLRLSGGDGGHNGINSIIYHLASDEFVRIRIGVGNTDFSQIDLAEYVLSNLSIEDGKLLDDIFANCSSLAESFIIGGKKQLLDTNSKLVRKNIDTSNNF